MKRDRRLQGLTSDHHRALVLASRVARGWEQDGAALAADVRQAFETSLAAHFLVEEELLLPALEAVGLGPLAERTRSDHAAMRRHLEAAERGDHERLRELAAVLEEHVRFEERELFPAAEARLPAQVLEAVAARCP